MFMADDPHPAVPATFSRGEKVKSAPAALDGCRPCEEQAARGRRVFARAITPGPDPAHAHQAGRSRGEAIQGRGEPVQRDGGRPKRGWRARYASSSWGVAVNGSIAPGGGNAWSRIAHSSSMTSFASRATARSLHRDGPRHVPSIRCAVTHRPEGRMRETRSYGSEGGGDQEVPPTPIPAGKEAIRDPHPGLACVMAKDRDQVTVRRRPADDLVHGRIVSPASPSTASRRKADQSSGVIGVAGPLSNASRNLASNACLARRF